MSGYFAYLRVSTPKQGEGVSLQEQRSAIERYARERGLQIREWFVEQETAAKRGRRVFRRMLDRLTLGQARGLIIHRIDRGTRNLRDWADIGELIDRGVDVRFVHDNLDLGSRGGRLAADIQAVIAADYIRNLRDEVRKGVQGRLKQGLYPLPAPLGYLDRGRGRAKVIDPSRAPQVVELFERYATGTYTFRSLAALAHERGLRNRQGEPVSADAISRILRNPFYAGLLKVRSHDERFAGIHEPLITRALFDRVTAVGRGETSTTRQTHAFTYRGLLRCTCGKAIVGEAKKGHVYYRCHRCPGTSLREEYLESQLREILGSIRLEGTIELESACRVMADHWRRQVANDHPPRVREAIVKTHTAQVQADRRLARFRTLLEQPALAFDASAGPVRQEFVRRLADVTVSGKTVQCRLRPPFDLFAAKSSNTHTVSEFAPAISPV